MKKITVIPGDGIGTEITKATLEVLDAMDLGLEYEIIEAGETAYEKYGKFIPDELFKSIEKNRVALKGPITTPIGYGFRSINVELRKKYDLFTNLRPVKRIGNVPSKFENVNLTIFRENTEDLYRGVEEEISKDEMHSIKIITRKGSTRIARAAFEYAKNNNIDKVTVVTKANIMKLTDGLFLECAREVAKDFEIELEELLIDNMCMQLVINPSRYNIILTENLYGDILSDLAAGLIGGLGLCPSGNIGEDIAMFEAVHGSAKDIAGKGIANPTALILSSAMMLNYMGLIKESNLLIDSVNEFLSTEKNFTKDLGGELSTDEYTKDLIEIIKSGRK